jgi:hypothetical protein
MKPLFTGCLYAALLFMATAVLAAEAAAGIYNGLDFGAALESRHAENLKLENFSGQSAQPGKIPDRILAGADEPHPAGAAPTP